MLENINQQTLSQKVDESHVLKNSKLSNKLVMLENIVNRCSFVSTAIKQQDSLPEQEHDTLMEILIHTKDGNDAGNVNELIEITNPPSCKQVNSVTCGKYCDQCELCGIIGTPVDLGFKPWNTKKHTMMLDGNLDEEIENAESLLKLHPDIYYQGERLIRVISNSLKAVSSCQPAPLEIQPLSSTSLREVLSKECIFLKVDKEGIKAVYPPLPLVHGLQERAKYPSLQHLRGITSVPVLRPDGTVLQSAGYDPDSELLFQPQREFPKVPESPTSEDVQAATRHLLEVVCDFPFSSDAGRAVYLSTILTVVGRYAFSGCVPMVLIDANSPGVGKTKLADTIGLITTGRLLARSTQATYALEERRQITSILLKGERFLLIDNIGSRFGSPTMDALLTSEYWQDRILGGSKEATIPNFLQVIATGNNLQLKSDTVRRCIRIQLEIPDEHPETRSEFQHPDLEAWVISMQPELLSAALTLLRGYITAGKPSQDLVTLGSFTGWANLIQATVKWAYGVDPGGARVQGDDEMDLDSEILDRLMRGFRNLVQPGTGMSCRKLMTAVLVGNDEASRDILEALELSDSSGKRTPVALGRLLTRFRKRGHNGFYLDHGGRTNEGLLWKLVSLK